MATGSGTSLPKVVVHVAVSLDGATTRFEVDAGVYYSLVGTWREDATLTGADTILEQEEALASAPQPGPSASGPLLAVVDGQMRVTQWTALRDCGYWSGVVAIRAHPGPEGPYQIVTGGDRVQLATALEELRSRFSAQVVRVDSGGRLIEALFNEGLVDELSLLVHPVVVGADAGTRWLGSGRVRPTGMALLSAEALESGLVWLRYERKDE